MAIWSNIIGIVGLGLQGATVFLGAVSAYYIWRQLTAVALTGQANVSEGLASQSIEIIKFIADDPLLYEYFYENKPLSDERPAEYHMRHGRSPACCTPPTARHKSRSLV
jgi:hypothetical protein